MNDLTDQQLLRDYAEHRSDAAFGELVRRHIDAVYSAALRLTGEEQSARDTTQAVFVVLAQKAASLTNHPVLSGWLHTTARNQACKSIRSEARRRICEQEAATMNQLLASGTDATWQHIAPHLDDALSELTEADRDALTLRYFEKKSAPEMAGLLGITEEAAQKRVTRAVDRLRELFSRRKVTVGTGGLAVLISANAVQSAPVGLAAVITTTALAGTAVSTATVIAATKTIAMTTFQKTLVTAALATAVGVGIFEAHQAAQLRDQNQALNQQQAPLADQVRQLQRERDDATNRLAGLADELAKVNDNNHELLNLRGQVGVLHQQINELGKLRQANEKLLAQLAAQSGSTNQLAPEDELILRQTHTVDAMTTLLNGVKSYAAKHNGEYPGSFDQLAASGDLETTNFAGNLGLDDFELAKDGAVDQQGEKVVLRLRVPLKRTDRLSVMVTGGIRADGVTHTDITNISSK